MIPRSLAYRILFGSNKIDGHKALDLIYDGFKESIGTCGQCAYCDIPHVREPARPCCTINYSSSHYWQEVELNGYCSKFERKDKA